MKKINLFFVSCLLMLMVACKKDKKVEDSQSDTKIDPSIEKTTEKPDNTSSEYVGKKVAIVMEAKSGSSVTGNAIFKQDKGVVTMIAVFSGLSEGIHAIHIHEKSDCSSDDGKSSGGHWNPTAEKHGKWGDENGYHKGDIGNFTADAKGNGTITFITDEWCIDCGDPKKDVLGKGIIVHQGVDDFTSQPSGAAGSRVSCGGVIE